MDTLETLRKRIATTEDLQSIVGTMKALSAVSIRQYEEAVAALRDYSRTIELGLQVVLQRNGPAMAARATVPAPVLAIVFGSDHGLCGRFNHEIAHFAQRALADAPAGTRYLVAGARPAAVLEAMGETVEQDFLLPGAVGGLSGTVHRILGAIDARRAQEPATRAQLFYNRRTTGGAAVPTSLPLLPLDPGWLAGLAQRRWAGRSLPSFTMSAEALLAALVRQHLFIGLFRAAAESAASEHATRLAAMQAAERNIEERLGEMNADYRRKRQDSITEELLDLVSGFEALKPAERLGQD
jgi:F-type H+-transporting ATPase subunit gamma